MMTATPNDTICALSTPTGSGALAVIRVSGPEAFSISDQIFSKDIAATENFPSLQYGTIRNDGRIVDEVVVSLFKGPHSFTGEDVVEISCHGSPYIRKEILSLLVAKGARPAEPGEYTMRAYLNGKMDLSQAEAVADLIASHSKAAHTLAMDQLRGGFSKDINALREQLIEFASLIELELDFSEEDVEFADRTRLLKLVDEILLLITKLASSFDLGNAIKSGVPVAIVGVPNVGKSTLLNAILSEERAIVSEIAGTTRDTIEDEIVIDGVGFRFIDTAGIRETGDKIEMIGIERTYQKVKEAQIVLYMIDADAYDIDRVKKVKASLDETMKSTDGLVYIVNKIDVSKDYADLKNFLDDQKHVIELSAKSQTGVDELKEELVTIIRDRGLGEQDVIVTNVRHYDALKKAEERLLAVKDGLGNDIPGDLIAMDIRQAIHHLGSITGEISTDDLLGSIFSNFCIGK